jgi:LPS sulfotransferase NodH
LPPPDDSNYERYLMAAIEAGTTPNGVFAAKLFWAHLHDLCNTPAISASLGDLPEHKRLLTLFGPDVHSVFVRRNCLHSASSLWRAETTGIWFQRSGDAPAPAPVHLDVGRVTTLHTEINAAEIGWPHFLTSAGIPSLTVQYNDIVKDVGSVVGRIAQFLGVDVPKRTTTISPTLRRQADSVTQQFIDQWTRITGGCSKCVEIRR